MTEAVARGATAKMPRARAAPAKTIARTCARCGTVAEPAPPTWTLQTSKRGSEWLCDTCTRAHLRSIEGRLDETWW